MEKTKQTIVDMAVIITVVLIVTAALGFTLWRAVLLPIPLAFALYVILTIGENIHARYRKR